MSKILSLTSCLSESSSCGAWMWFGLAHGLDIGNFSLQSVDHILDRVVKAVGHLFIRADEKFVNLHWH